MSHGELYAGPNPPLPSRQDRIEASIVRVLRAGGTRSALRELVYQFADLARIGGVPPELAVDRINAVAMRAVRGMGDPAAAVVGDSAADRISMIVRWCAARYHRAD
jgi:hypothetical protein